MFDKLFSIFKPTPDKEPDGDERDNKQMAVATLLVEAARADETYSDQEKTIIEKAVANLFSIDASDARQLRIDAEAAQAAAVDLHGSTKIAKLLSLEDKTQLIESLWTIILSDGERDAYEDTLVRRICGLIHFSDRESGEARQRVAKKIS